MAALETEAETLFEQLELEITTQFQLLPPEFRQGPTWVDITRHLWTSTATTEFKMTATGTGSGNN
jgi:hypothetical protein